MAKKKRLNVYNSQKMFNLTLREPIVREKVTLENYDIFDKVITEFIEGQDEFIPERDDKEYRVYYNQEIPYEFILKLVDYGGIVEIITDESLPISLIDKMVSFPRNCFVTYTFKEEYTEKEISNIQQSSAGLKTSIYIETDDSVDSYTILTSLADIPFIIDQVIIRYRGHDYDIEYEMFNDIRDALSGWKMSIVFETWDKKQKKYMTKRKEVDEKIRKSSTVWKKK